LLVFLIAAFAMKWREDLERVPQFDVAYGMGEIWKPLKVLAMPRGCLTSSGLFTFG
jgi:hypothetical protein